MVLRLTVLLSLLTLLSTPGWARPPPPPSKKKSVTYRKTDSLSDNGLLLLELLSQIELKNFRIYFQQDSTFTFKDVAPQWQSFNVGRLLDVENGVRYMAQYLYGTLNVTRT